MTIDGAVEKLAAIQGAKPYDFMAQAKRVLLEVARDQRHACAEAVLRPQGEAPDLATAGHQSIWRDKVHQAVMNATIK